MIVTNYIMERMYAMFVIDRRICACCHNCACECPAQAIDFVGTKYQIDQEKCLQCGLCAKVCHTGACHEEGAAETIIYHDPITLDADVVVVGSGSGMVAATRAAQAGKKVIVLEKSSKTGGNTDFAHGFMTPYSKWHERLGFKDTRDDMVEMTYERGGRIIEKDLIRTAIYGVSAFFDWLCDHSDIEKTFNLKDPNDSNFVGPAFAAGMAEMPFRQRDNLLCRDDAIGPGWGGTFVKYTCFETIEKENLDVKVLIRTAAEHLILDDEGKICGVEARDPGGVVKINCKAVMLACGGFGRNDDLLRKYADFDFFGGETEIHRFSVPGDTGDGITMLQELGVEPNPDRMTVSMFGPKHHPFNNSLADFALEAEFIQVNMNGKRWIGEMNNGIMFGYSQKISEQPKEISYAIMPYDQLKACAERFVADPRQWNKKHFYATWEEDIEHEATLDTPVKKADTLEELGVLIGADPKVFVDEIKKYNSFCEKGVDEDFGKDPKFLIPIPLDKGPYYAVYGQRFSEAAMGGVTVNDKTQVLRNDGSIIPGLYAGGDCTSAMHRKGELAPLSELTWAMAASYVAGGNMVRYIDGKEEKAGGAA